MLPMLGQRIAAGGGSLEPALTSGVIRAPKGLISSHSCHRSRHRKSAKAYGESPPIAPGAPSCPLRRSAAPGRCISTPPRAPQSRPLQKPCLPSYTSSMPKTLMRTSFACSTTSLGRRGEAGSHLSGQPSASRKKSSRTINCARNPRNRQSQLCRKRTCGFKPCYPVRS